MRRMRMPDIKSSAMETQNEIQNETQNKAKTRVQVAKSTAVMSLCTLVSRATGFVRTWAMAFALGNTVMAAGFSLANNLPNMIYELVAGGVLSTAFLPIYLQQRNQHGTASSSDYASNLLSIAMVFLGSIALLASIFAPQVIVTQSLFSDASNETVTAAVWFFRFLAFEIVFYGASAIFSGILNAEREFFWPAISSVFMNIVAIVGFFAYPFIADVDQQAATTWLGITMLASIAIMAFVQVPALLKTGIRFRFLIDFGEEGFKDTIKLALPAIACTAINLVSLSVMNSCALHVAANGPSSISYAWMWYQFPYGVLGVALSTAVFTEMSDAASRKDRVRFKEHMLAGLSTTLMLIIPMAAMLFSCAYELIGLYSAGRFSASDIQPIATLLMGWAVNLPIYAAYMFVYRVFSALKDMKTVAICNAVLTCFQVCFYLLFTGVIKVGSFSGFGLIGISVGDICFYTLMLVTLLGILQHRMSSLSIASIVPSVAKVSLASLAGGVAAYFLSRGLDGLLDTSAAVGSFIALVITGIVGLSIIWVACRLLRVDEITRLVEAIRRKLARR